MKNEAEQWFNNEIVKKNIDELKTKHEKPKGVMTRQAEEQHLGYSQYCKEHGNEVQTSLL